MPAALLLTPAHKLLSSCKPHCTGYCNKNVKTHTIAANADNIY